MHIRVLFVSLPFLLAAPLVRAQPCPGVPPWTFADVALADDFCGSITFMATSGVTTGCQVIDANNRNYCPDAFVTRKQMAGFMDRFADKAAFAQGGNAFGAAAILGTTDDFALDIRVNNRRVMRYEPHSLSPNLVGGTAANEIVAGVRGGTIAGGGLPAGDTDPDFVEEGPNRVTDGFGTVGGGFGNVAGDDAGTTVDRPYATVAGGKANRAQGRWATVSGGGANLASGAYATVAGGYKNLAGGEGATVGGGGFIGCGEGCEVFFNNAAMGPFSTVPGGAGNVAAGNASFAAGLRAKALHNGAFVWADDSPNDFESLGARSYNVRATGGMRIVTDVDGQGAALWTCTLVAGGGWNCSSDRRLKQDMKPLDGEAVLGRLVGLPVYQWRPIGRNAHVRHFGPTAQDFHAAFGLGADDTMIGLQDADGVALAAIQGLNARHEAERAAKDTEIAALKRDLAELRVAVEALMARTSGDGRVAHAR